MHLERFLTDLQEKGIEIWIDENNKLAYRDPENTLTEWEKNSLKAHEQLILKQLRQGNFISLTYPLSAGQEALWFLYKTAPDSTAYNTCSISCRIRHTIDPSILQEVFQVLVNRHACFRTLFSINKAGRAMQQVYAYKSVHLQQINASGQNEAQLRQMVEREYNRPFDLENEIPIRMFLISRSQKDHILLLTEHHIANDGGSALTIKNEFQEIYKAKDKGDEIRLPVLNHSYKNFVESQKKIMDSPQGKTDLAHWKTRLADESAPLDLPFDYPRPPVQRFKGATRYFELDPYLSQKIKSLATSCKTTLLRTFLAAFTLFLNRYSAQDDIVVGIPASIRPMPAFKGIVGYFVNMLPIRTDLSEAQDFKTLLKQINVATREAIQHKHYPFPVILKALKIYRDLSLPPVFQSSFTLYDKGLESIFNEKAGMNLNHIEAEPFILAQQEGQFDLFVSLLEAENRFTGTFNFNTDLFKNETIDRMMGHFKTLLKGIAEDPHRKISDIPMLTDEERHQILITFNDTKADYPDNTCIHHLFESQADRTPDAVAVTFEGQHLTYKELNEQANRLGHFLRKAGVSPGNLVGICLERSFTMIIGLLGVLKAGGAYVPLDPDYPEDRLAFMIQDAGTSILLCQNKIAARVLDTKARVIYLDEDWDLIAQESIENPTHRTSPLDPIYAIYTSGSTGKPKGVINIHQALCNRLSWMQKAYPLTFEDRVLQKTPFSFDVSGWEFFWPLLFGASLVFAKPGGHKDSAYLVHLIQREKITYLHFVPSMLQVFLTEKGVEKCTSIKRVICSGEVLPFKLKESFFNRLDAELHNLYGPTEAAIDVSYWQCNKGKEPTIVPIGYPIDNTQLYILNKELEPVPIGVSGELHIGGVGLAAGYLNRPNLTKKKFIVNPFSDLAGARLYKTGDLCRFLPDGAIEYLGRMDHQVQIRGFRIELGEIECILGAHEQVNEVVVIVREYHTGDKKLTAYLTMKTQDNRPEADELQMFLKAKLPDYMIPAFYVIMDAFPLSPNGKIDRNALPEPDIRTLSPISGFVPPGNPHEQLLADLFSEVLGIDEIGIHDSFFDLGGDSIQSLKVIAKAKEAGLEFSLEQLYKKQTVYELARMAYVLHEVSSGISVKPFSFLADQDRWLKGREDLEDAYPLSALQAGMYFHTEYHRDTAVYHDVFSYHIQGYPESGLLEKALQGLANHHPVLRTSFATTGFSELLQLIHNKVKVSLAFQDLTTMSFEAQEEAIDAWMEKEKMDPFDWSKAPLVRFAMHFRSPNSFNLGVSFHHAILDGWSVASMVAELIREYQNLLKGKPSLAGPVSWGFRDFLGLERASVASKECGNFWRQKLEDFNFLEIPRLPNPLPADRTDTIESKQVLLSPELLADLKNISQQANVPIKSVLLAAHMKVLRGLSASSDITTGLVLNGRHESSDAENTLGLFLNTVPFRLDLSAGTWLNLVKETFQEEVDVMPFRRYPLSEIQKNAGGESLFEVIFGFNHFHVLKSTGDLRIKEGKFFERTNFPLVVNFDVNPLTSEMVLRIVYNSNEFLDNQVELLTGYYINTLKAMVKDPFGQYQSHSVLSEQEKNKILVEFNDTALDYPKDKCIHHLFEAEAEKRPHTIALFYKETQLTYKELNTRANRLGRYLQKLGVRPDTLVGICMGRSIEMIVGILGILKAGGAYLPIDPEYPAERITYMLEDAQASVLLTQAELRSTLPKGNGDIVCLDGDWKRIAKEHGDNLKSNVAPGNMAYVIYTSGSTGAPKGSAISHEAIVQLVKNTNYINIEPEERISHASNVAFDAATFEIWGTLANGATMVCIERETALSPSKLAACIREKRIRIMFLTTALFNRIAELKPSAFAPLSYLLFGGEAVNPRWVKNVLEKAPPGQLLHFYGPTETTTFATWWHVTHVPEGARTIPIGRPISNKCCYILDQNRNPVPVGVPGELYIGGAGLALGYLNRPALTKEAFIPDPFSDTPGSRLYKTGDLCRFLPEGAIEFLGRIDHQVKIRGFRIELGEIESILSGHELVKDTVVIAQDDPSGEKQLAAYLVYKDKEKPPGPDDVRKFLEAKLPEYMIPTSFIILDALPLTPNGKIDRRALPMANLDRMRERELIGPTNKTEEVITKIWKEVLNLEKVSIHDNFFRIGGHSLAAVAVVSRMEAIFGREISIKNLFELPTIGELGRYMEHAQSSAGKREYRPISLVKRTGPCELSLTQQRLWYLSNLDDGKNFTYNIPISCNARGELDISVVHRTLNEIISRHEVLRMVIRDAKDPVQVVFPELTIDLPLVDISGLPEKERKNAAIQIASEEGLKPFDLTQGPFIRALIIRLSDQEHILLITMHHIIFDGWSTGVFFKEFEHLYGAFASGKPSPLRDLDNQYTDFTYWQKEVFSGEILETHVDYWEKHLAGAPLLFELPTDHPRPPVQTFNGDSIHFELQADLAEQIKTFTQKSNVTLFMTMHAAFATLLAKLTGKEDIVIGTLIANRNHKQIEPLIGFFGNLLPLRADLSGDPAFTSLLNRVKTRIVSAYEHQELPFQMLLDGLGIKRNTSHSPLFQVVFDSPNVGPFGESFDIGGVTFTISDFDVFNVTKYDLDVSVEERGGKIKGTLVYNTNLFLRSTIEKIKDRFVALLADIVSHPDKKISQLSMEPLFLQKRKT